MSAPSPATGPGPDEPGEGGRPAGSTARRRTLTVLRRLYVVGLVALAGALVWSRRSDLADLLATAELGWLGLALLLTIGQLLPSTVLWQRGVGTLGHPVTLGDSASATGRSVLARYLPGGIWYAVGRGASLRKATGVPARVVGAVALLEMALSLVVAASLVVLLLPFTDAGVPGVTLAIGVVGALALASPPSLNAALAWVARRRGGLAPRLTWSAWAGLAGITVVHWAWSVLSFGVYLQAFPGLDLDVGVAGLAIRFLIAWIIGFLSLFAPQGAGVFETVIATLLVDRGRVLVAVAAGGYRAVLLVRDLVVGAAAWVATRPGRGAGQSGQGDGTGGDRPT